MPDQSRSTLDAQELAFLVGGPARVAETVIAELLSAGRARISPDGRLAAFVRPGAAQLSELEEGALVAINGSGFRFVGQIVEAVAISAAILGIRDRLAARGLVCGRRSTRRTSIGSLVVGDARRLVATGGRSSPGGGSLCPDLPDICELKSAAGAVALGGLGAFPDAEVVAAVVAGHLGERYEAAAQARENPEPWYLSFG